ncbi:MAG: methylated-DNA--[Synergistaceae bacterium]|nr:methylated-DNA--[protein]-cysteine S-methyltransferase [Synergistaceae bacterium]
MTHCYDSPLGEITVFSDGENITGLYFTDQLSDVNPQSTDDAPIFAQADEWLNIYFSGRSPDFTPPLKVEGSEFHREVCGIMLAIPFGHVMTYSEIAGLITQRRNIPHMSARAVGGSASRNRISLMIPCHRVIGAKGNLTGYGGGIERKMKLLELEGIDTRNFFMPPI